MNRDTFINEQETDVTLGVTRNALKEDMFARNVTFYRDQEVLYRRYIRAKRDFWTDYGTSTLREDIRFEKRKGRDCAMKTKGGPGDSGTSDTYVPISKERKGRGREVFEAETCIWDWGWEGDGVEGRWDVTQKNVTKKLMDSRQSFKKENETSKSIE